MEGSSMEEGTHPSCRDRVLVRVSLAVFLCAVLASVGCQSYEITELRLVDGPSDAPNSGRVEALHERTGNWINVCDVNYWGDNDGTVACRQLGFPGFSRTRRASFYGEGAHNGSVGGIGCSGDEYSLRQCPHRPVQESTGCKGRVTGLVCTVPGFLGCFTDNRNQRVFPDVRLTTANMTIGLCLDRCRRQGARYAGLENRRDCYCGAEGTRIDIYGRLRDRDCKGYCLGNADEVCGGGGKLSIYDVTLGYCMDPGAPSNGGRAPAADGEFHYGVGVTFFCRDGFELVGSNSARCILGDSPQEVHWDQPVPPCRPLSVSTTVTTPLPGQGDDTQSSDRAAGRIAGIVVVCVVVLVLLAVGVNLVIRKRRRKLDRNANKTARTEHGTCNAYSESNHASRYQATPDSTNASGEYQDLTLPFNDAERPYTSLRKPAPISTSEKEIPEYIELYGEGVGPLDKELEGGRPPKPVLAGGADAGKGPPGAGQTASRTGEARLPTPEVNDSEYSYVDTSRLSSHHQAQRTSQPQATRPQQSPEYTEVNNVYCNVPDA